MKLQTSHSCYCLDWDRLKRADNLIKTDITTHAKLAEKGISPKGYYYMKRSNPGFILCN